MNIDKWTRKRASILTTVGTAGLVGAIALAGCGDDPVVSGTPTVDGGGTGTVDSGGGGGGDECTAPTTKCGDACVNTQSDAKNCGTCGKACDAGQVCGNGACASTCPDGQDKCGDSCIDTKTDIKNCGTCGNPCKDGEVCSAGVCGLTCSNVQKKCGGGVGDAGAGPLFCANIQTDKNNCGDCGTKCGGADTCIDASCGLACANSSTCPATMGKCAGGKRCAVPTDCADLLAAYPTAPSGKYTIDPDGAAGEAPFEAYCDMTTDGGGWTIIASRTGGDDEQGLVGDTAVAGDALAFAYYNLTRAQKAALSKISTESAFVRQGGGVLKADKPLFSDKLLTADMHEEIAAVLTSNGVTSPGFIGWSNFNIGGGGDFGVSMHDGNTCSGPTTMGFDHHAAAYYHLNCGCQRQFFYSYSNNTQDSDASYKANTGLGDWTATAGCDSSEGGGMTFYAAMRRKVVAPATALSCAAIKAANAAAADGMYLIDTDGAGANPAVWAFCDMTTDGGGYTTVAIDQGISTNRFDQANSCAALGMQIAVPRTKAHLTAMFNKYGNNYMQTMPGIYGLNSGIGPYPNNTYTNRVFNSSDATIADNWKSVDGKAWFIHELTNHGEPNGDYTPGCWLGTYGQLYPEGLRFNDGGCGYYTGGSYLCSDNAK